jgi:hypothetical protein
MMQTKNSYTDIKPKPHYMREDSQNPVSGDSNQIKGLESYDHFFLKNDASPFIVDWQLQDNEVPERYKLHS